MCDKPEDKEKRVVPVFSFDEFMEALKAGKSLLPGGTGCYKIREEDKEKYLEYLKNR